MVREGDQGVLSVKLQVEQATAVLKNARRDWFAHVAKRNGQVNQYDEAGAAGEGVGVAEALERVEQLAAQAAEGAGGGVGGVG